MLSHSITRLVVLLVFGSFTLIIENQLLVLRGSPKVDGSKLTALCFGSRIDPRLWHRLLCQSSAGGCGLANYPGGADRWNLE